MDKKEIEQELSNSNQHIDSLINQINKLRKDKKELQNYFIDFIESVKKEEYTNSTLEKIKEKIRRW